MSTDFATRRAAWLRLPGYSLAGMAAGSLMADTLEIGTAIGVPVLGALLIAVVLCEKLDTLVSDARQGLSIALTRALGTAIGCSLSLPPGVPPLWVSAGISAVLFGLVWLARTRLGRNP
jgi:uncharacterized membrane-anchored protein